MAAETNDALLSRSLLERGNARVNVDLNFSIYAPLPLPSGKNDIVPVVASRAATCWKDTHDRHVVLSASKSRNLPSQSYSTNVSGLSTYGGTLK